MRGKTQAEWQRMLPLVTSGPNQSREKPARLVQQSRPPPRAGRAAPFMGIIPYSEAAVKHPVTTTGVQKTCRQAPVAAFRVEPTRSEL
jgi:hypothetical protein